MTVCLLRIQCSSEVILAGYIQSFHWRFQCEQPADTKEGSQFYHQRDIPSCASMRKFSSPPAGRMIQLLQKEHMELKKIMGFL